MALALPIIIYNFLGFELMSSASQEMRNPKRDVPRTIVIAGVLIGAFYLIATIGMQVVMPADELVRDQRSHGRARRRSSATPAWPDSRHGRSASASCTRSSPR